MHVCTALLCPHHPGSRLPPSPRVDAACPLDIGTSCPVSVAQPCALLPQAGHPPPAQEDPSWVRRPPGRGPCHHGGGPGPPWMEGWLPGPAGRCQWAQMGHVRHTVTSPWRWPRASGRSRTAEPPPSSPQGSWNRGGRPGGCGRGAMLGSPRGVLARQRGGTRSPERLGHRGRAVRAGGEDVTLNSALGLGRGTGGSGKGQRPPSRHVAFTVSRGGRSLGCSGQRIQAGRLPRPRGRERPQTLTRCRGASAQSCVTGRSPCLRGVRPSRAERAGTVTRTVTRTGTGGRRAAAFGMPRDGPSERPAAKCSRQQGGRVPCPCVLGGPELPGGSAAFSQNLTNRV